MVGANVAMLSNRCCWHSQSAPVSVNMDKQVFDVVVPPPPPPLAIFPGKRHQAWPTAHSNQPIAQRIAQWWRTVGRHLLLATTQTFPFSLSLSCFSSFFPSQVISSSFCPAFFAPFQKRILCKLFWRPFVFTRFLHQHHSPMALLHNYVEELFNT